MKKIFNKKLRTLKTDNPKEFWKLICTNEGSDVNSKIHINVLAEYFANLNKDDNTYEEYEVQRSVDKSDFQNEFLNMPFHEDEIMTVLSSLKSGKSAGPDCLINEFFKMSRNSICGLFTKMFNVILKCGHIPETWSSGWIVPIYKNNGNKDDPNNYRGISLINCICKVFTSVISARITRYCDSVQLIGNEQAGFRKSFPPVIIYFIYMY